MTSSTPRLALDRPASPVNWKWVLLIWLIPAVIATLQSAAGYATRGMLAKEWPYAALQFPRWMAWALVTPLVFEVQRRYPLTPPHLRRAIARHLGVAVVVVLVMEAIWIPPSLWISASLNPGAQQETPLTGLIVFALLGRIIPGTITYGAILGVASTLHSRDALRQRELAASQLEGQLAQAQLSALKMQVQPHFLFNTLHAITVLIPTDPSGATRMVARLGDLLRLTLSRAQAREVTLEHELELVRLYLDIESVRFADRLTVHYDIPADVLDASIPDLLLQPLVENAIKHGLASSRDAGVLRLIARRDGRWLEVEVHNTGRAVTDHTVRDGIGLSVTRARLAGLYGEQHHFSVTMKAEGGAVARVRIPWKALASQETATING